MCILEHLWYFVVLEMGFLPFPLISVTYYIYTFELQIIVIINYQFENNLSKYKITHKMRRNLDEGVKT